MAKMGRPTLLNKHLKELAVKIARENGMTLAKLAAKLGISRTTLYLYLRDDKDFSNAIEKSLAMSDDLVEISLFRRAVGYSHVEEKIFYDSERGKVVRARTMKHYPPSDQAMQFYLKNRKPDDYRDKVEDDAPKDIPIEIAKDEQDL